LFLLDESGFSEVASLQRTWALRGHTPTRSTSLKHNERLNLIGGLGVTPAKRKIKLHLQSYRKSITGEEVIRFLEHLLNSSRGAIVLVWDRHPIHRRAKVKDFIAQHPRLHVYELRGLHRITPRNFDVLSSPVLLEPAVPQVVFGLVFMHRTCLGKDQDWNINY
jgi:hypothetical protein